MFRIAKIQIEIELLDDHAPPGYWGARLRGGYGWVLRQGVCTHLDLKDCRACERFRTCAYPPLFEPSRTGEESKLADAPLKHKTSLPRSFVIEPPPRLSRAPRRGERLPFSFTFFGMRAQQIAYPVIAFSILGGQGLHGKAGRRARFRIVDVRDELAEGRSIFYRGELGAAVIRPLSEVIAEQRWEAAPTQLTINFLTPTRIENQSARQCDEHSGKLARLTDFYELVYNLAQRVAGLWQLYGEDWMGQAEFFRWRERLLKASKAIQVVENRLAMTRLWRHSNRQQQDLMMDGFTGQISFAGDFAPFEELLKIGVLIHIGQQTTFGLGRYQLQCA